MRLRAAFVAIVGLIVVGSRGAAQRVQGVPPLLPVRGVVFDSVRGRPLRDALVTIDAGRSTTTDMHGRFHFDSVPEGMRTISVQAASLDTLGFFGISRQARVHETAGEIRVAVPSFATLWRNACGTSKAPSDSGIIYGVVRDVRTKAPVRGARLDLVWTELALREVAADRPKQVVERRWKSDTRTIDDGTYVFCGVPKQQVVRLQASTDSAETGVIEVETTDVPVHREDLVVGMKTGQRGLLVGYLLDDTGLPFIDARVTLDDSLEARSEFDGRFVFVNAATGSHQLVARYIGATPVRRTANVIAGDTTLVWMTMSKVVTLSTMNVASPERARMLRTQYEDRQIMYHRFMFDSTYVSRQHSLVNVLQSIANVRVRRAGLSTFTLQVPDRHNGFCTPELRVDGVLIDDFAQLATIPPSRVVGLEVYPFATQVPPELQRGGIRNECGMVAVWTRWAFRIP
ncbi:MAG TPA: carboxypeptidase-like regulatory domain-containing protein [Gemmatimonadaceae bacterium]|jgi:hypothetical protein